MNSDITFSNEILSKKMFKKQQFKKKHTDDPSLSQSKHLTLIGLLLSLLNNAEQGKTISFQEGFKLLFTTSVVCVFCQLPSSRNL
jgi:hypothetical protein